MSTGAGLEPADLDPADLDPADIGRAHRALDPIHSLIYFAPDAEQVLVAAGLRPGRMTYFASRAAPMGAVTAGVVTATFYNFNPELIARFFPRAWTLASPEAVINARFVAADVAMRRLLGGAIEEAPAVLELTELIKTAASACRPEGRPLFAGHAGLAWPEQPHLALWHGISLLREHRGDGHIIALASAGLSGIESLITHTATGRGFRIPAAKQLRGWSDEQWDAAQRALRVRGVLDDEGALTEQGVTLRADIEAQTDILARDPWVRLGAVGTQRLIELAKPLARRARDNGAFPAEVFA
ncbi:MAG: hypothetical protein ABI382_08695 [Nakamurella sp.]